jgi:large subunit ribosomal protein L7Ae
MAVKKTRRRKAGQKPAGQQASTESAFKPRPKNFSTGCAILPKTHKLGRMMKWPKYIRIQRQEQVLKQRLKVPPAIALFDRAADKTLANQCFKLFKEYQPPTRAQRKQRLRELAEAKAKGDNSEPAKEIQIKFGLNHVTNLVQAKKAQLVLIAHDVDPLELVVWLPTLCYKMDVPFAIVKGKAALGKLVNMKSATAVCLSQVQSKHSHDLELLTTSVRAAFNDQFPELRKKKGEAKFGRKTNQRLGL